MSAQVSPTAILMEAITCTLLASSSTLSRTTLAPDDEQRMRRAIDAVNGLVRLSACECPEHGTWIKADGVNAFCRQAAQAMFGDAAPAAPSLCDVAPDIIRNLTTHRARAAVKPWQLDLAEALDNFWNAALQAERDDMSGTAAIVHGVNAVATRLREQAER